jgi:hypothetical protein
MSDILVRLVVYKVNLCVFYFYRLIGKLTTSFHLQEFIIRIKSCIEGIIRIKSCILVFANITDSDNQGKVPNESNIDRDNPNQVSSYYHD